LPAIERAVLVDLKKEKTMSVTTLGIIIALVLFLHGIGHVMGLIPILGIASTETWHAQSWLLTDLIGETASRIVGFVLFAAGLVGFIGAALGLMDWLVPHDAWRTLAIVSAVISFIAIALFWNAFVMLFPNKIGAIAVNAAVLIGLLMASWPTELQLGY
jgi:hypothetical protein